MTNLTTKFAADDTLPPVELSPRPNLVIAIEAAGKLILASQSRTGEPLKKAGYAIVDHLVDAQLLEEPDDDVQVREASSAERERFLTSGQEYLIEDATALTPRF
jgi:hypothetical protein